MKHGPALRVLGRAWLTVGLLVLVGRSAMACVPGEVLDASAHPGVWPPKRLLRCVGGGETIRFDRDQKMTEGLLIESSGVTVDCQGHVLDGQGRVPTAILIDSMGEPVTDITIQNCTLQNFRQYGLRVGWGAADTQKMPRPGQTLYDRHPSRITLRNLIIRQAGGIGLYVDDHVQNLTLQNSRIERSGKLAVYLEFLSRRSRLIGNQFVNNGTRLDGREAVAIDGSTDNELRDNHFVGNRKGGVFLYKNCQEHASRGGSARRPVGANRNRLIGNDFVDEKVGIWLAARQSKNQYHMDCGDPALLWLPGLAYYTDLADNNDVLNNRFCRVSRGIISEGDRNRLAGNRFEQAGRYRIQQPVTMRQRISGHAPTANQYRDNGPGPACR